MPLFINNLNYDAIGFPEAAGGGPRVIAYPTNDLIILAPGNLNGLSGGAWGLDGSDTILGSISNERLFGNEGNDSIVGAPGIDVLYGGRGNDVLDGNENIDLVRGDRGHDTVSGNAANDVLRGGRGNDLLQGGEGSDFLSGDVGTDTLIGGNGADTLYISPLTSLVNALLPNANVPNTTISNADVIADFFPGDGDVIALPIGLSPNTLNTQELIDFDGDGLANDTVIRYSPTGEVLAVALNVNHNQLKNSFVPVDSAVINLNGSNLSTVPGFI